MRQLTIELCLFLALMLACQLRGQDVGVPIPWTKARGCFGSNFDGEQWACSAWLARW